MFQCDIIDRLQARSMDDVVDNILRRLDASSLRNCELVSQTWRRSVRSGRMWKKLLDAKVKSDSLWRKMFDRLNGQISAEEPLFHKRMASTIGAAIERLDGNWRSGRGARIALNADVETDPFFRISGDRLVSRAYGTLGLLSDLLIFDLRDAGIRKEIHVQANVNCYDVNELFVCCGLDDGTILIVDADTGEVLNVLVDPRGRVASLCLCPGLLISVSGDDDPPSDVGVEKDWLLTVWRVVSATDIDQQRQLSFGGEWLHVAGDDRYAAVLQVRSRGADSAVHFIAADSGRLVRSVAFDYTNDIWQYAGGLFVTCRRRPPRGAEPAARRTLRITDVALGTSITKDVETCSDNTYHLALNRDFLVCSGRSGMTKLLEIYDVDAVMDPAASPGRCLLSQISWPEERRYGFFRMNEFYVVGLGDSGWDLDMNFHVLDFTK